MFKNFLPKSEFLKNMLTLLTGTTIAQIIPIAVSPILTRLYSPEEFGVFALYVSITTIIAAVATGRYELAILLPKCDTQALNLVALSIVFSFITGTITLFLVFSFNSQITDLLNAPNLSKWLYFMALSVFLTGLYQSLNYWNNREKKYIDLSKSKILQTGSTSLFNVGAGFLNFGVSGLIVGTIIGIALAVIVLLRASFIGKLNLIGIVHYRKMLALAKTYVDFLKFSTMSALFNNFSNIGLPIIISLFFDNAVVGLYYFASRIIRLPLKLILNSLSQVYFQKAAQLYLTDKVKLLDFTQQIQLRILIFVAPFLLIASFVAPLAFKFVFGPEWAAAGEYVKYFAIFVFFNSLYSPISALGSILNKQKQLLYFNICLVMSQLIVIYYCSSYFSFEITLMIISIIGGLQFLGLNMYMRDVLNKNFVEETLAQKNGK